MRCLALVAALLLLFCGSVRAQDRKQQQDDPPSFASGMVQVLKEELALSDDQVKKATVVIEKGLLHLMANMLARENGQDPDDDVVKDEIVDGLKGFLDDGQKKELDVLVHEFETQSGRFEMGIPDELDPETLDLSAPIERVAAKADLWFEGEMPTVERLLLRAENVLLLSEEEKKVVLPRVQAVVEARRALREAKHERRASLGIAVKAGAKNDEIAERLHDLRRKTDELERRLAKACADLREVLTLEQEARLVAVGILD